MTVNGPTMCILSGRLVERTPIRRRIGVPASGGADEFVCSSDATRPMQLGNAEPYRGPSPSRGSFGRGTGASRCAPALHACAWRAVSSQQLEHNGVHGWMVSRSRTGCQTRHPREPIGYTLTIRPLPERHVPGQLLPPLLASRIFEAEVAQPFLSRGSSSGCRVGDITMRILSDGFAE